MKKYFLSVKEISQLPRQPGVYFFYSEGKKPIYIGKAVDLRRRVQNHFPNQAKRDKERNEIKLQQSQQPTYKDSLFINEVKKIGYIPLQSEIEALILESQLIKKYQPKFNVVFRDDKNYFYVGITNEDWPRVFITHQPLKQLATGNWQLTTTNKQQVKSQKKQKIKKLSVVNCKLPIDYLGPFVGGAALKETLKILRKIFPYRSCKTLPKKPCLWYELNRCPAPCLILNEIKELKNQYKERKKDYQKNIKNLKMVLKGKKETLLSSLEKEMQQYAKNQEFEKAAKTRDEIKSLKEIFSHKFLFPFELTKKDLKEKKENVGKLFKKALSLPNVPQKIEGYDISHIQGKNMVGSMVVFRFSSIEKEYKPAKKEYRLFKIKTIKKQNDTECLKEVVRRRFSHQEWQFPDLIYVDGGKGQFNAVKSVIAEEKKLSIPIISLAKKRNILYNSTLQNPISLDKLPQIIKMTILRLRDETHRFAISYHKKLRAYEFV